MTCVPDIEVSTGKRTDYNTGNRRRANTCSHNAPENAKISRPALIRPLGDKVRSILLNADYAK
jgi:hypothetical protein